MGCGDIPEGYRDPTTFHPLKMSRYLTVKEAAALVGKSPSSIRRIIYPIIEADNHVDRHQVQPSIADAQALRLRGENFPWRINEEFLLQVVRADPPVEKVSDATTKRPNRNAAEGGLLEIMLREELAIKNTQITQQMELISMQAGLLQGLSERLKEGNILMGSLQQRLALPAITVTENTSSVTKQPSKNSSRSEKGSGSAKPPRRSMRDRFPILFRPIF